MSKRYIYLISLLFLFFLSLKFDAPKNIALDFLNFIKIKYHLITDTIENKIKEHLNQQETIKRLLKENRELQKYKLELNSYKNELYSLKKECNASIKSFKDVKLVRTISYTSFGDFSSLWVDFDDFNNSKIYGLVKDDFAAGIITEKDGRALALLVNNKKCAFAVEVGEEKAPGIAMGRKNGEMVIKFIPMHKMIKVGDEVVTSGLDKIFFYGIKVGRVKEVKKRGSYKVAVIQPYANVYSPKYFWAIVNIE